MKTTSILAWWAAVCLGAAACGGSATPICGAGYDGVPNIIPDEAQLDTFWVGRLGVDELQVLGAGADHDTLVQAHFNDFTDYRVQLAPSLPFGESCIVYTGQPVPTGTIGRLEVTSVTLQGLAGGDLVMEPDAYGRLAPVTLPGRAFVAPRVDIAVASGAGPEDFPAFSASLPAPVAPVVRRLGDLSPVDLASAPSLGISSQQGYDVELEWEPGGGDYVEVLLVPGAGSSTPYGKLRCITFDDGCLAIPYSALNHLALDAATNFRLRIERHQFRLHSERDGDQVRAAALVDLSSSLEAVVLR
jgi:hypothetical protein